MSLDNFDAALTALENESADLEPQGGLSASEALAQGDDLTGSLAYGFARRLRWLAIQRHAPADAVRALARAAAETSRATADGHVCIELVTLAERSGESLRVWRERLFASGLVGRTTDQPLVLDAHDRLYLARYYDYEQRLARALGALATSREPLDAASLRSRLDAFPGTPPENEVDWQRVAAALSLDRRLTIISGGPGTGKTTTVVGILACLLTGNPALRIALAAPTGKAAQRMQEALLSRAGTLPAAIVERLPTRASTLHRLLGAGGGGPFRYRRGRPLPYDAVVVDEASMIDVAMGARLLDAIAPHARLILLGDKDQLAAVEAGAVFAELSARPVLSVKRLNVLAEALGLPVETLRAQWPGVVQGPGLATDEASSSHSPLADCVVWLEKNYRFGLDSPIGRLSLAIRAGDARAALDELSEEPDAAARLIDDTEVQLSPALISHLGQGFASYASALARISADADLASSEVPVRPESLAGLSTLFDALNRFRVLCAVRSGPRGVERLNALLSVQLRNLIGVSVSAAGKAGAGTSWFAGRPVMVTRNDYALGLFNGDIGIALSGVDGSLRVVFPSADGAGWRAVSPAALPPHETALALTVHKSQGSEFERAVLVLPAQSNRSLTRELVYTAVTRAKLTVEIIGGAAVLAEAIATPTRRASGLALRLVEAQPGVVESPNR